MFGKVSTAAATLLGFHCVQHAWAHGKLTVPASRNELGGSAQCAHCLNGGGPCGDGPNGRALDFFQGPQAEWTAGSIVPITVVVTAHHMGHYEFRVCDSVLNSSTSDPEGCLNRWVLQRATPEEAASAFGLSPCSSGDQRPFCVPFDSRHPERWYLPPRGEISGTHTMYFKVPADLQCEVCTLQWHWWSANSCEPAGDYGCFKQVLQSNGYWTGSKAPWWTAFGGGCSGPAGSNGHTGCGEQFWNCADITVLPGGGVPPSRPTVVPTTTVPIALPTTATTAVVGPTLRPTTSAPPVTSSTATPGMSCERCAAQFPKGPCIWGDGKCYPVAKDVCQDASFQGNTWCGEPSFLQAEIPEKMQIRRHSFRGASLGEGHALISMDFWLTCQGARAIEGRGALARVGLLASSISFLKPGAEAAGLEQSQP